VLDWSVIVSNTLSALVGISVTIVIQNPLLAMPIAASLAILGMFILRCLHPPAAAVALIAALGNVMHYRYAFFPVMIDSIPLVIVGGYLQQYDR
jgi:CBS domain-containing membrane protein